MCDFLKIKTYWFVSFKTIINNKTISGDRIIINTRPFWRKIDIGNIHENKELLNVRL